MHRELIYLNRRQFVWQSGFHELLLVRNYDLKRHVITLTIDFAADFADIFEVRGQSRARHGKHAADLVGPNTVMLRYRGLDEVERTTSVCFSPTPTGPYDKWRYIFAGAGPRRVVPGGDCAVLCDQSDAEDWSVTQFYRALRAERREFRAARVRAVSLEGSNPIFNELTERSAADIYLLNTDTEHGPYPFAGIPWYSTPFGRDGIITAMMTLWLDPTIAKGVLRFSRRHRPRQLTMKGCQARQDPARDAERRNGPAGRGAVRPLLRLGRRDPPFRHAARASTSPAPAISIWYGRYGRMRSRRCTGSTPTVIPTATASSSMSGTAAPG